MPQFDDEESDSSSDEESSTTYRRLEKTARHHAGPQHDNFNDNNNEDVTDVDASHHAAMPASMQWNGIHQIQQLTNANSTLSDQVDILKRQLKG